MLVGNLNNFFQIIQRSRIFFFFTSNETLIPHRLCEENVLRKYFPSRSSFPLTLAKRLSEQRILLSFPKSLLVWLRSVSLESLYCQCFYFLFTCVFLRSGDENTICSVRILNKTVRKSGVCHVAASWSLMSGMSYESLWRDLHGHTYAHAYRCVYIGF